MLKWLSLKLKFKKITEINVLPKVLEARCLGMEVRVTRTQSPLKHWLEDSLVSNENQSLL